MMLPTHALFGALIASISLFIAPEYTMVALAAGIAGSIFPDLDMVFLHRKTFHYPFYFSVLALIAVVLAAIMPIPYMIFAAFFLIGAAVHSVSDIFGGDLGFRPWEKKDDRGVYYHYGKRWIRPKRWIPYDGSPQDFVLSLILGAPILALYSGIVDYFVYISLGVAFTYMLVRKKITEIPFAQRF